MKVLFVVSTKDGGEGFDDLLNSIISNVEYARNNSIDFSYKAILVINGNPKKPDYFIRQNPKLRSFFDVIHVPFSGKVKSINYVLSLYNSEFIVLLDDDISFEKECILHGLEKMSSKNDLWLIGFKNQVKKFEGLSLIKKFSHDIINVRSLCDLYKNIDPFLFGRLLIIKRELLKIPDNIINEDLYLSIILDEHFLILENKIYYNGESSIYKHIKRVLRIETGRIQLKNIFNKKYDIITSKSIRIIDEKRLSNLSFYYKLCYFLYKLLRFFTNSVIVRFSKHKDSHW